MAAFDIVMAFVALVSFIAGFCCAHMIHTQKRRYKASFSSARKKNRKDYVRIEDKENHYEYESQTEKKTNTNTKNSKFDVLLNYFSDKTPKKQAYQPRHQPYAATTIAATPTAVATAAPHNINVFERSAAPLYPKTEPVKREFLPESPVVTATQPVAAPIIPAQKSEVDRKKEKSGDEWVPMGFFED